MPAGETVGDWDLYVMFANRLNWTPEQVDAQDPDFIDQMTAYFAAQAAHDKTQAEKASKPKPGSKPIGRRRHS